MVFQGFILPPKNQKAYEKEIALAVFNQKNDALKYAPSGILREMPVAQPVAQPVTQPTTAQIMRNFMEQPAETEVPKIAMPLSKMTPSIIQELKSKLASPKMGLSPKKKPSPLVTEDARSEDTPTLLSAASSPASSEGKPSPMNKSGPPSPAGTESTWASLASLKEDQAGVVTKKEQKEYQKELLLNFFKQEIMKGNPVIGVKGNTDTNIYEKDGKTIKKKYLLGLNENGDLITNDKNKYGINTKFDSSNLAKSLYYNLKHQGFTEEVAKQVQKNLTVPDQAILGQGLVKTYKTPNNGEKNFGNFHLSMLGLNKGNLSIYRPKSNSLVLQRKKMTPRLTKMVRQIKQTRSFELEDYDLLSKPEQIIIDRIINLLRMDYPAKMRRTLDEEVWNLKQRYEILISELNAGNQSDLAVSELKDVLKKLFDYKAISRPKYLFILKALE